MTENLKKRLRDVWGRLDKFFGSTIEARDYIILNRAEVSALVVEHENLRQTLSNLLDWVDERNEGDEPYLSIEEARKVLQP